MTVAAQFVGVWRRRSIAVDDGLPEERHSVVWVQARDAFADLRVPRGRDGDVDAFAGITTYDAPALTWHHALDLNGTFAGFDCGVVARRDDELVERGTFDRDGTTHAYEEVWQHIDRGIVGLVLTAPRAMIVRVGDHSLAMRDRRAESATFDVRYAHLEYGRWRDVHVLGAGSALPLVPVDVPSTWTRDSTVELGGQCWRVGESWS